MSSESSYPLLSNHISHTWLYTPSHAPRSTLVIICPGASIILNHFNIICILNSKTVDIKMVFYYIKILLKWFNIYVLICIWINRLYHWRDNRSECNWCKWCNRYRAHGAAMVLNPHENQQCWRVTTQFNSFCTLKIKILNISKDLNTSVQIVNKLIIVKK